MPIPLHRFSFNTAIIGGDLEHKLATIGAAGFTSVELWAKDLLSLPGGVKAAASAVQHSGLRVSGFQLLRDFDSAPKDVRARKIEIAKDLMHFMRLADARLLRVSATALPSSIDDRERAAEDLATLATLAIPMGIKIGFEALPWSAWIQDCSHAWDVVRRANLPNLGLVPNSLDMFLHPCSLDTLQQIPVEKIFQVSLADCIMQHGQPVESLQQHRLLPGEGTQQFSQLLSILQEKGYQGDFVFDALNDDYVGADPSLVAASAMKSAVWLSNGGNVGSAQQRPL